MVHIWHDTTTNNRGKQPSTKTTFENRLGKSNIDLTLATSNLLGRITDWKISDEESNSDHSIITYCIKMRKKHKNNTNTKEQKYRVNSENIEKYNKNLSRTVEIISWEQSSETSENDLYTRL